jgi:hypothetical protein
VKHIGRPSCIDVTGSQFGGSESQARESDVVVDPIPVVRIAVRRSVAIIQRGTQQHVNDQTVRGFKLADVTSRKTGE